MIQLMCLVCSSIVKNPVLRGDFTWRGYDQTVNLDQWKWGTRPIYRFNKTDTLRHRGIRYQQYDTRRETTKKFVYLNRVEGQIYRDYLPGEFDWVEEEILAKKKAKEEALAKAKEEAEKQAEEEEAEDDEEYDDEEEYEEEEDEEEDEN